jgi:hypothetical protein
MLMKNSRSSRTAPSRAATARERTFRQIFGCFSRERTLQIDGKFENPAIGFVFSNLPNGICGGQVRIGFVAQNGCVGHSRSAKNAFSSPFAAGVSWGK